MDDNKTARDLQEQALKKTIERLGPEHPETLASMTNLATSLANQGLWSEAERHARFAWEIRSKLLGNEHPDTATSAWVYFNCLHKLERHEDAVKIIRSLEWLCKSVDESLPLDLRELRKHLQPFFTVRKEHIQPVPPANVQKAAEAQNLMQQEQWAEAEAIWRQLYNEHVENDGEQHPDTAQAAFMLYQCLYRQEKTQPAQTVLESLLWVIETDEAEIPDGLKQLRAILRRITGAETPEELLKKLSDLEEEHGETAKQVLLAKANTAVYLASKEEWPHAANLFGSLHEYHLEQDGKQHPHTALIGWNYFMCLHKQDKHEDARAAFEALSWLHKADENTLQEELRGLRKQIDEFIEDEATPYS